MFKTPDALQATTLVPGTEAMDILLRAMSLGTEGEQAAAEVRRSFAAFEEMVRTHVGDRPTLELFMDGMMRGSRTLEVSRRLAFRGNSGIWGVQARVRSMTQLLAPNREQPDRLDIAIAAGLHDIRRLRSAQGWPIFRFARYGADGFLTKEPRKLEALEKAQAPDEPLLIMRSFCSPPGAEVRSVQSEMDVAHELMDGPIGQQGAVSFLFGMLERNSVPRYAEAGAVEPEFGELGALVTMPTELIHVDVLVHQSMLDSFVPELVIYGRPFAGAEINPRVRDLYKLPIEEVITRIEYGAGAFASDQLPDQERLVQAIFTKGNWRAEEFVGFRVQIPFPPMPSTVTIRYPLSPSPG